LTEALLFKHLFPACGSLPYSVADNVDSYTDSALGVMEKDKLAKISMTKVTLRPHFVLYQFH